MFCDKVLEDNSSQSGSENLQSFSSPEFLAESSGGLKKCFKKFQYKLRVFNGKSPYLLTRLASYADT